MGTPSKCMSMPVKGVVPKSLRPASEVAGPHAFPFEDVGGTLQPYVITTLNGRQDQQVSKARTASGKTKL